MKLRSTLFLAASLTLLTALSGPAPAHEAGFFNTFWGPNNMDWSAGLGASYTHRFTEHWAIDARGYWYFDVSPSREYRLEPAFVSLGPAYVDRINDNLDWYVSAAVSGWWFEQEESEENEEAIYETGFLALAGVQYAICDHWAIFGDLHYIWVEPELELEAVGSGIKQDVKMDGPGFSFGLKYVW